MMKTAGKRYDAILLLGLALGKDDQPEEELCVRVRTAAKAYREHPGIRIVACGGITTGHKVSEAEVMQGLLLKEGVPAQDIVMENESKTTIENFVNAAKIVGGGKGSRYLIVTSDYHVRRSVLTARRAGLKADGYPAPLEHDEAWELKKGKEFGYTVDLLMGWQDEGRTRPQWAYRLFDLVFGKKG